MRFVLGVAIVFGLASQVFAAADSQSAESTDTSDKFGPFGLFDHRSSLGTGFFPEPFLVDEGDTDRELELNWLHQEGHGSNTDQVKGEIEWNFGLATIELEAPYERDTFPLHDLITGTTTTGRTEGMDAPRISLRHPIWQWVSEDGRIDNTLVVGAEVAVPSNSPVGKDTEIVPQLFDLLRLGDHFGLQIHAGYSTLLGSDPSNKRTLEYSADLSYRLSDSDIPLPRGVEEIVPIVELAGDRGLNKGDLSDNLTGVLGCRFNLDAIGPFSPRLGIGYVFPIDKQARKDFSWGVVTSLVFDF
jgi:hypothetical protein